MTFMQVNRILRQFAIIILDLGIHLLDLARFFFAADHVLETQQLRDGHVKIWHSLIKT